MYAAHNYHGAKMPPNGFWEREVAPQRGPHKGATKFCSNLCVAIEPGAWHGGSESSWAEFHWCHPPPTPPFLPLLMSSLILPSTPGDCQAAEHQRSTITSPVMTDAELAPAFKANVLYSTFVTPTTSEMLAEWAGDWDINEFMVEARSTISFVLPSDIFMVVSCDLSCDVYLLCFVTGCCTTRREE